MPLMLRDIALIPTAPRLAPLHLAILVTILVGSMPLDCLSHPTLKERRRNRLTCIHAKRQHKTSFVMSVQSLELIGIGKVGKDTSSNGGERSETSDGEEGRGSLLL